MATLSLYPSLAFSRGWAYTGGGREVLFSFYYYATSSTEIRPHSSFNLNDLLKILSSNIVPLEVRTSAYDLQGVGGMAHGSVYSTKDKNNLI